MVLLVVGCCLLQCTQNEHDGVQFLLAHILMLLVVEWSCGCFGRMILFFMR